MTKNSNLTTAKRLKNDECSCADKKEKKENLS